VTRPAHEFMALRRLAADAGIDMAPEPSAFPEFVLCEAGHNVEIGKDCARCELTCAHGCTTPGPDCKGRCSEEE
jgi:hypothetical protein